MSKDVGSEEVASPCVSVCFLDENDICEGCYRSAQEITDWMSYSNAEKKAVLELGQERFKEKNKHLLL